jgi:hypothetical protein
MRLLSLCCWPTYKDIAQWALSIVQWVIKKLPTVCWSLEEFCLILSKILQCFGKLQDTWRSRFICGARMNPLNLPNPSKYPDLYVITQQLRILSQLTNKFQTLLSLFLTCTGVHCGLKYQHQPMKQTLIVDQKGFQWCVVPI